MPVWLVSVRLPQDSTSSTMNGSSMKPFLSECCPREPRGCVHGAGVEFKVCAKTSIISSYQIHFVYDEPKS